MLCHWHNPTSSRFDRTMTCDGWTDGQTDTQTRDHSTDHANVDHTSTASQCKNQPLQKHTAALPPSSKSTAKLNKTFQCKRHQVSHVSCERWRRTLVCVRGKHCRDPDPRVLPWLDQRCQPRSDTTALYCHAPQTQCIKCECQSFKRKYFTIAENNDKINMAIRR